MLQNIKNKNPNNVVKNHLNSSNNSEINKVLFETIFDNSGLGIIVENYEGKILKVNHAFSMMLGYSQDELLSFQYKDIAHPHDCETDKKLFEELVKGTRSQYSLEVRFITKCGNILHAEITRFEVDKQKFENRILTLVHDLSAKQKIIDDLKSNENLFNALLENSTDKIYFKDLQGRFIKVNKTVANLHGFASPELLIGKTDFDIFNREHAVEAYNDEQQIIRTKKPIICKEERIVWADGKVTWASTSKMPFYDNRNNIIGIIGITRDITENKTTQELLSNERILMRTIINNLPDAIYAKDLECRKTFLNRQDWENLGCTCEEEALGKTDYDFFADEIASTFYADDLSVMSSGNSILNREEYLRGDNGQEKWLLTSKLPLKNDDGQIFGLVGIGHDITLRRRSEKIKEAIYNISEAANTTSDMHTLYKRLYEIIQTLIPANNFYIALYDEKTKLISFPYFVDEKIKTMPTRKLGNGLNNYVINKNEPVLHTSDQILELKKSGEICISYEPAAVWLGVPLKLEGKASGLIVLRDYQNKNAYKEDDLQLLNFVSFQIAQVIDRKRSSDAIAKYADKLKQLNQTKDKFFSIIAHDLKNPFITILGFSELLLSDFKELTDDEKIFYIESMQKSAESSHNLLQNLLQWSRSQTGRIEFSPTKLPIDSLIMQSIELLKPTAEAKDISIIFDDDKKLNVFADQDMVDTVIRNLFSNAIKFTKRKGEIKFVIADNGDHVNVSITDNGIGMTEETICNLFRLDISKSTSGTEQETGTGLGLIICKEFIEKNGGTIFVESKIGEGTTFNFTLPKPKL